MTFREPVLGLFSLDFVYVFMNRIETNSPVCRLYHYWMIILKGSTYSHKILQVTLLYRCLEIKYEMAKLQDKAIWTEFLVHRVNAM